MIVKLVFCAKPWRKLASFREPDYLLSALVAIEESQNHVVVATTAKELLKMIQSSDLTYSPALLELETSVLRLRMYYIIEAPPQGSR